METKLYITNYGCNGQIILNEISEEKYKKFLKFCHFTLIINQKIIHQYYNEYTFINMYNLFETDIENNLLWLKDDIIKIFDYDLKKILVNIQQYNIKYEFRPEIINKIEYTLKNIDKIVNEAIIKNIIE